MNINEFFDHYEKIALSEQDLLQIKVIEDKENDLLKGSPPCLKMLSERGIPNGMRNNCDV
jgi:hypothetical protein